MEYISLKGGHRVFIKIDCSLDNKANLSKFTRNEIKERSLKRKLNEKSTLEQYMEKSEISLSK